MGYCSYRNPEVNIYRTPLQRQLSLEMRRRLSQGQAGQPQPVKDVPTTSKGLAEKGTRWVTLSLPPSLSSLSSLQPFNNKTAAAPAAIKNDASPVVDIELEEVPECVWIFLKSYSDKNIGQ